MSVDSLKNTFYQLDEAYESVSGQIDAVLHEGLSAFDFGELDAITSKVSLSLQQNSLFNDEVSTLLETLRALNIAPLDGLSSEEFESIEKALEQLQKNCINHGLSLSHLDSLLKTKQISMHLFNPQCPTQLPEASRHFIQALNAGEDLKTTQKLGEGSFGIVQRASIGGLELAKKTLCPAETMEQQNKNIASLERESAILLAMDHPNIIKIVATTLDPPTLYTLEVNRNSLFSLLNTSVIYIPENLLNIFEGVSSALTYLHDTMHLSHCDLHTSNILIQEQEGRLTGLLTDFEKSSNKSSLSATTGNIHTQAPETMIAHEDIRNSYIKLNRIKRSSKDGFDREVEEAKQKTIEDYLDAPISEKNDIWAFGVCLFSYLTCGKSPYEITKTKQYNLLRSAIKLNNPDLLTRLIRRVRNRQVFNGSSLYFDNPLPQDFVKNVISQCFQLNKDLRPSADELNRYFQEKIHEIQAQNAAMDAQEP